MRIQFVVPFFCFVIGAIKGIISPVLKSKEIGMRHCFIKSFAFLALTIFFVNGCATGRGRKVEVQPETSNHMASMQAELAAKDQQIQDLQYQLDQSRSSYLGNYVSDRSTGSKSSIIRVSGVSGMDIQRALKRAGFEPGPIDGRIGKKTKAAVKAFQRSRGLYADGIVGEKTWAHLQG